MNNDEKKVLDEYHQAVIDAFAETATVLLFVGVVVLLGIGWALLS